MTRIAPTFGQRLLPSTLGEQGLASAFAVVGTRHLLCVADASANPSPATLARAAVDAALLSLREASQAHAATNRSGQAGLDALDLVTATTEAAAAVRRAGLGVAPGAELSVDLAVLALDAQSGVAEIALAGRLAFFSVRWRDAPAARVTALTLSQPSAHLDRNAGDGPRTGSHRLDPEASLVIASRGAALHAPAALRAARGQGDPHLLARSVAESARRAGDEGAIFIGVLDRRDDGPRDGLHPAFVKMQREAPRTFDGDGHVLGSRFRPKGAAARRLRVATPVHAGRALAILALVCGLAVLAWQLLRPELATSTAPLGLARLGRAEPVSPLPDAPPPPAPQAARAPPPLPDAALESALAAPSAQQIATRLRGYITSHGPRDMDAVFTRLDAAILGPLRARTLSVAVLDALGLLAADTSLPRTSRWATRVLARARRADANEAPKEGAPGPSAPAPSAPRAKTPPPE